MHLAIAFSTHVALLTRLAARHPPTIPAPLWPLPLSSVPHFWSTAPKLHTAVPCVPLARAPPRPHPLLASPSGGAVPAHPFYAPAVLSPLTWSTGRCKSRTRCTSRVWPAPPGGAAASGRGRSASNCCRHRPKPARHPRQQVEFHSFKLGSARTQKHGPAKKPQLHLSLIALSPHLPEASADAAKEAVR